MLAAVLADNFTDPAHERLIWLAAGGLVVLGVGLAVLTWFWWRGTKGEHAALAPLEVMGDRSWSKLTHVEQTRRLESVRLRGEGDVEPVPAAVPVDLDEALRSFQPGFDDLRDEPATNLPRGAEVAAIDVDDAVATTGEVTAEPTASSTAGSAEAPESPPTDSTASPEQVEVETVDAPSADVDTEPAETETETEHAAVDAEPVDERPPSRNGDVRVDPLLESETVDR